MINTKHSCACYLKDMYGVESDWSYIHEMIITRPVFLVGLITNLNLEYDTYYKFNASLLLCITLDIFSIKFYSNNEEMAISEEYEGLLFGFLIFGRFNVALMP